jgi:ABC-type transport system involved in multi-copper enzyme maturation permease subunit
MSVYKSNYRAYIGHVTPMWMRIYVVARYGFAEAWSSKITVALFTLSLLPVLVFLAGIYLANNPIALLVLLKNSAGKLSVNAAFFLNMLQVQSWIALAITAWIAPRLISFDLADNALPILLSHPISRPGYVLGKFMAMFVSLSTVTWIPCLLLFAYESYSSPEPWMLAHLSIAAGILAGGVLWIVFLSILGLAISSWVKWRVVATGAIFAAVFVPAGVGAIVSAVLRTQWGLLLNVPVMMNILWGRLLGASDALPRIGLSLPTPAITVMLALACLLCIAMLNARIRAREVVRG